MLKFLKIKNGMTTSQSDNLLITIYFVLLGFIRKKAIKKEVIPV